MIKITPKDPALQIEPPFHAYSAHRAMTRAPFDLKNPDDVDAFLDLAADADVLIESFRPGVVAKLTTALNATVRPVTRERCAEPPLVREATIVGNYRMLGES